MTTAVLLLSAPDRPGLVHAAAGFVLEHGGNVIAAEQHVDVDRTGSAVFFQRIEFRTGDLGRDVEAAFAPIAREFGMTVSVRFPEDRLKLAVMVSREEHCLADLLMRHRTGELPADIVAVISNHPDHSDLAAFCGIDYYELPVTAATKAQQEHQVLDVLQTAGTDLVVLARYMQILSPVLLDPYAGKIINIHHSFLPAFAGARPYHQAHRRGVKLIGATAHYATAELDEGPIIAQDVNPVSHRDSVADLVRVGRDLETVVLARAVRAHLEHRTLVHGSKTIIFV